MCNIITQLYFILISLFQICFTESSDQNDDYDSSDSKSGRLQMLQQESINRLDRLKLVVDKMDEVREQRDMLALQVQEKMKRECKDAEEQDDLDLIGSLKGSKDDIEAAIKKKLHTRHRNLVCVTVLCNKKKLILKTTLGKIFLKIVVIYDILMSRIYQNIMLKNY